jgi:hypothetical protein
MKTVARCRRTWRRPTPSSVPAPRPTRTASASPALTGTAPHEDERPPVLGHQRRRGARPPPSPLLFSSSTPLLLFPHGGEHRKGKPPKRLGLREGLGLEGCRVRSRGQVHGHDVRPGWLVWWGLRRGGAAVEW